jgi:membrane protein insertase Oxa1/YidC/SpoIIIJ
MNNSFITLPKFNLTTETIINFIVSLCISFFLVNNLLFTTQSNREVLEISPTFIENYEIQNTIQNDIYKEISFDKVGNIKSFILNRSPFHNITSNFNEEIGFQFLISQLEIDGQVLEFQKTNIIVEDEKQIIEFFYNNDNLSYLKRFHISQGSYIIELEHIITNKSSNNISVVQTNGLNIDNVQNKNNVNLIFNKNNQFQSLSSPQSELASIIGCYDNYLILLVIPVCEKQEKVIASQSTDQKQSLIIGDKEIITPGEKRKFSNLIYCGFKEKTELIKILEKKILNSDQQGVISSFEKDGFLWWIDMGLLRLLDIGKLLFANWGFSLIFTTILIKLLFLPFAKEFEFCRKIIEETRPLLENIELQYADDSERQSIATINLYKSYGLTPVRILLSIITRFIELPFIYRLFHIIRTDLRFYKSEIFFLELSSKDPSFIFPSLVASLLILSFFRSFFKKYEDLQLKPELLLSILLIGLSSSLIFSATNGVLVYLLTNFLFTYFFNIFLK